MKLSQAINYHARTPVDGWSTSAGWVPSIALVSLASFDRFITERSFGQKKRILTSPTGLEVFGNYPVIKLPNGSRYLLAAHNPDISGLSVYANTYLVQEAPYEVEIYQLSASKAASGMPSEAVPSLIDRSYCDMERLGGSDSRQFESTSYTTMVATLPFGTDLSVDMSLKVGGFWYEVSEVWQTMRVVQAKIEKRTSV